MNVLKVEPLADWDGGVDRYTARGRNGAFRLAYIDVCPRGVGPNHNEASVYLSGRSRRDGERDPIILELTLSDARRLAGLLIGREGLAAIRAGHPASAGVLARMEEAYNEQP